MRVPGRVLSEDHEIEIGVRAGLSTRPRPDDCDSADVRPRAHAATPTRTVPTTCPRASSRNVASSIVADPSSVSPSPAYIPRARLANFV